MSKTKQGGSSRLGRDSAAQRLGIKAYSGEKVKVGMIIIRQRGTKYLLIIIKGVQMILFMPPAMELSVLALN